MRILTSIIGLLLCAAPLWAQTGTITGRVVDADTGEPLPAANVIIEGTTQGTATDIDGNFTVNLIRTGTYDLLISYTGYQNAERTITVVAFEIAEINIELVPGIELDPVQITAGRQQEKVLEAPASISVINAREIEIEAPQTAVRALRNVTGLDIAQTGVDRHEVVLRGFNSAFNGAAHVMTDYRQAGAAVIGVNLHSIMPSLPIDIERVEVVRGPGAALYGPGVDSGVIHYITKDAFSYPGATIAVGGGQRSLMNFQGRVAGVVGEKLGLKLTGTYGRANDFELESCDATLLQEQRFSECPDEVDAQQLYIDGPRDNKFRKSMLSAYAEYRFNSRTSLVLNGGLGSVHSAVLSGIGTIQGSGYYSAFMQARFNSGPFFAQAYLNRNDSGDSYVYNGDPVIELSTQTNIQAQYDMHIGGREELVFGVDLEFLSPNSDGTVYGRNEDNDAVQEFGGYVQSKTELSSKLDVVVAIRGDYHNVFDKVRISPRAGIVFKPSTANSFRLTYNSTYVNPSATSLFLDLLAARLPIGPDAFLPIRGRGGVDGYTWNRNPAYLSLGAPTDLVASSLLPGLEGSDAPVGLPTDMIYGLMYEGMAAIPDEDLAALLIESLGLDPALLDLLTTQMGTVKALLHPDQTQVQGFSPGQLGLLNISSLQIDPIADNELQPLPGIKPQRSSTIEVGYKGIVSENILLAIDVYRSEKRNFIGGLQMKTPFVLVPTLTQDLTRDLADGIANNDPLLMLLDLLGTLGGLELTPEAAAALLVGIAGSQLPGATTPVGIVQTAESHAGIGNIPELLVTYPNFGHISYFGADAAIQILASDDLSLFANLSWVSDDYFDHTETGEESESQVLALNAPALKLKLGGSYRLDNGLSITSSGRYVDGFQMVSGQYIGKVEPYFLLDLGIGYDIRRGLRADLNVSNITDNLHREFIGAPKIGRVGTLRLLYNAGW